MNISKPLEIIGKFLNIMKRAIAERLGVLDLLHFASLANG